MTGETTGPDVDGEDFVLTVDSVFRVTGRGTVVTGPVESGVIRTGDVVEIRDHDGRVFLQTRVRVEAVTGTGLDPATIALMVGDIDQALLSRGQTVRRRQARPTGSGLSSAHYRVLLNAKEEGYLADLETDCDLCLESAGYRERQATLAWIVADIIKRGLIGLYLDEEDLPAERALEIAADPANWERPARDYYSLFLTTDGLALYRGEGPGADPSWAGGPFRWTVSPAGWSGLQENRNFGVEQDDLSDADVFSAVAQFGDDRPSSERALGPAGPDAQGDGGEDGTAPAGG